MKFRKKPVVIEAHQWFKNGDHPEDKCEMVPSNLVPFLSEGKVVRYFWHPNMTGDTVCVNCSRIFHDHGWIDTLEGGHNVCPGDWIITGVKNERYPCKPDIFEITYEPVEPPRCKHGVLGVDSCFECDPNTGQVEVVK
jgi:hypothetical protein